MLVNWVKETVSGTPGVGSISLGGAFDTSFLAISQAYEDGDPLYYTVEDGSNREEGIGTYESTGNLLLRTTPLKTMDSGVYDNTSPTAISLTSAAIVGIAGLAQTQFGKARTIETTNKYFIAGNINYLGDTGAKGGGAFTASSGRITARYYFFPHRTLITTLGAEVHTVSAGGNFDLAIYSVKDGSLAGGNLLASTGNLSTTASGLVSATLGTPLNIAAGWYLFLAKVDNTTATFSGARPANGRFSMQPDGGIGTGRGAHIINYWNTTYATAFLSTIDAYGAPGGSTGWETPEGVMS